MAKNVKSLGKKMEKNKKNQKATTKFNDNGVTNLNEKMRNRNNKINYKRMQKVPEI